MYDYFLKYFTLRMRLFEFFLKQCAKVGPKWGLNLQVQSRIGVSTTCLSFS